MAGTNAVALKEILLAKLQAAPALAGVQLTYGWPGQDIERERVWFGRITGTQKYRGIGAQAMKPRDETLILKVYVEVELDGDGGPEAQHGADVRAQTLGQALEDAIASDPGLTSSGSGPRWAGVVGVALEGGATTTGRYAQLIYDLQFFSRLR